MKKIESVIEYIESFPKSIQTRLKKIRSLILKNAPNAVESISYGMPAYKTNGKPLIYFAGYEKHIGLYATPNANLKFSKELAPYKQGKGSIQFSLETPLPLELITRIIVFRVSENESKKKE
jgi:uncharacterized protein YdhG (YjbR/CyaY superfamily)